MINWKKEHVIIRKLSLEGKTLQEIGNMYSVSREMIRQVLKKYYPAMTKKERGAGLKIEQEKKKKIERLYLKTGRYTAQHATDLSNAMSQAFIRKRQNAKSGKWGWNLLPSDLEWPLECPILGIELDWFSSFKKDNSPSFDRVDPAKGYEPGNVIICSWRANRIKNDGTEEEHRKIAEFLKDYRK